MKKQASTLFLTAHLYRVQEIGTERTAEVSILRIALFYENKADVIRI